MSFGIAGICICISIGLVTASPRVQHPLPARQGKKPVTGLETCTGQGDSSSRANPGEEQIQEKSKPWKAEWSSGKLGSHGEAQCLQLEHGRGWLPSPECLSSSAPCSISPALIKPSAVEQGCGLFSQHRGKYESTELLSGVTMLCCKQLGGRGGSAVGTSTSSGEEPGMARAESSSSSKMLVQLREEVSTLPARNCSLCWHGQKEKYDGKQED